MTPRRFDMVGRNGRRIVAGVLLVVAIVTSATSLPLAAIFALLTAVMWLFHDELTLDPGTREYSVWRGVALFTKPCAGTFDDIRAIRIDAKENVGRCGYYRTYPVTLEWERGPSFSYPLYEGSDFEQAAATTVEVADLTGKPVWESEHLAALRVALSDIPYTKHLPQP